MQQAKIAPKTDNSLMGKVMRNNTTFGTPLRKATPVVKKSLMPKKTTTPIVKKTAMPKLTKVKNPTRPNAKSPSMAKVQKSVAKSMGY